VRGEEPIAPVRYPCIGPATSGAESLSNGQQGGGERGGIRGESNLGRTCAADKLIPEAWVGEDIIVLVGEGLESLEGPLLEVNDREPLSTIC